MALKRAMDSWASSLRPYRLPKSTTATCNNVSPAAIARGKRSLASDETPKKSRVDTKRTSIEKGSKYLSLIAPRVKTPTLMKTKATQNTQRRRTLIPVYQKAPAERSSRAVSSSSEQGVSSLTEEICERLRALEIKVEHTTELAQNRIKELIEKNNNLVEESDRLRILLQDKIDEIWELKEDGIEAAKKFNDKALEAKQLETRLGDQLSSFRDLEKKYRALQAKFSIAKKIADFRDSESRTFQDLLGVEQKKIIEANEKVTSAKAEMKAMQSRWLKSQEKLGEIHSKLLEAQGNIRVYARIQPGSNRKSPNVVLKQEEQSVVIDKPSPSEGEQNRVSFNFDRVFDSHNSLSDILDELEPLIASAVNGHDVCVVAYGQNGTELTHTTEGGPPKTSTSDFNVNADIGIVIMAFTKALELVEALQNSVHEFHIAAHLIHIHDEIEEQKIYDSSDESKTFQAQLSLDGKREESTFGEGAEDVESTPTQQILRSMDKAQRQKFLADIERSRRSHCIYHMRITTQHRESRVIRSGVLNFVNLAALESSRGSFDEEMNFKGSEDSNSSLMVLLSVYSSLGNKTTQVPEVPRKDSKLHQFLSSALSSESKIIILAHLSPEEERLTDSVESLKILQKIREVRIDCRSRDAIDVPPTTTVPMELRK